MSRRAKFIWMVFIAGVAWTCVHMFVVLKQTRFPGPDIFQFKLPGIELARYGTLTGINLPNSAQDTRTVYAFYPPLYPFLYGLWAKLFGTTYGPSVLFDAIWRLLRSGLLLLWVSALVSVRLWDKPKRALVGIAFVTLCSLLPNNEDRPDELGLTAALASLYLANYSGRLSTLWAGVLLGLAGAASPTAGVFGGVGHLVLGAFVHSKRVVIVGAISIVVFALVVFPVVYSDPTAISRFLTGVHYNALPYANRSAHARMDTQGIASFIFHLKLSMGMGRATFWCLLVNSLVVIGLLCGSSRVRLQNRICILSFVFCAFSLIVFSIEPLYLWFSCCLLMVVVLAHFWMLSSSRKAACLAVALFLSVGLMVVREAKLLVDGLIRSDPQRLSSVQAYLRSVLHEKDRLVVKSDSFFSAPHLAADNVDFVCGRVFEVYDYAWITESVSFQPINARVPAPMITSLCYWKPACFHLLADRRSTQRFRLFGLEFPYYVRGFGGTLYQNRCKLTGIVPPA